MSQNPARKLLRSAAKRSKVVGEIPGAPGQPTPGHETEQAPPQEKRQTLPLNATQLNILKGAQARVADAQRELEAGIKMVMAQHGILEGRVTRVLDSRPPVLEVYVPEKTKKGKKGR